MPSILSEKYMAHMTSTVWSAANAWICKQKKVCCCHNTGEDQRQWNKYLTIFIGTLRINGEMLLRVWREVSTTLESLCVTLCKAYAEDAFVKACMALQFPRYCLCGQLMLEGLHLGPVHLIFADYNIEAGQMCLRC